MNPWADQDRFVMGEPTEDELRAARPWLVGAVIFSAVIWCAAILAVWKWW